MKQLLKRMEITVFRAALEEIKIAKSSEGEVLTKPFLDACKHMLPVVDKCGASMSLVKNIVDANIMKLESRYLSNPAKFNNLQSILRADAAAKATKSSSSCTTALLWLTRAMDFLVELFRNLLDHEDWSMIHACMISYNKTLKKWHGWICGSSFMAIVKLVPDRNKVMEVIGGTKDVRHDMVLLCTTFPPLLEQNHKYLAGVGMDNHKSP
uniref:Glycolipid transfer protein domain-containing protein n=1 Tax=Kalanchoe fedtschenkoi TaxID=63787 RepID=A0A7N0VIC2_KALFE